MQSNPGDSRRLLLAVVAAFVVAYACENALPLLLGSLVDGLALGVTTLAGLAGGVIAAVLILPVARAVDRF
jgi:UDP-N-acetylmuramyl pentapeptide phosphotransferase/UDP-N-acetylglucosamine-1-phosphate transferase